MRLSNYSLSYPKQFAAGGPLDVFKFLSLCRQLGMAGASLHVRDLESTKDDYLQRVRRAYLDSGLSVAMFTVSTNFGVAENLQEAELEKAREGVRVASIIGAPLVRVFAGSAPAEAERDKAFARSAAAVRKLCAEAFKAGIPIGLQQHNHGALVRTGDEVEKFFKLVNHPNLVFVLDTGQFAGSPGASGKVPDDLKGADYLKSIRQTAGMARHVRAKFYNPDTDGSEPMLDYQEIFNILRGVHYHGFIDIVYEPLPGAPAPQKAVPLFARYLYTKIREFEAAPLPRDATPSRYADADQADKLFADPAVKTETSLAFTEGPVADHDGNIFFVNIPFEQILKWDVKARKLSVFREKSGEANGLRIDPQGRLIACEGKAGRVTRTDLKTGKVEVLVDQFNGKPLGAPNDLELDAKGRIYFTSRLANTDSKVGNVSAVYRIDPDGKTQRILAIPEIDMPNGIATSPDDRILYLIDADGRDKRARKIRAYELKPDGTVANERLVVDFYPGRSGDGMKVDAEGNLWVMAGLHRRRGSSETLDTRPGLHVFSPQGKLLGFLETPEDTVTNCCFGGPDLKTFYITCGKLLLSVRTKVAGKAAYRV